MLNRINKLIYLLLAIREFAKYIHYTSKGDAFYSKHKLCDDIVEDFDDYIDDLKEVCIMGNGQLPLEDYLKNAAALIPTSSENDKENFKKLNQLIKNTLSHINGIEDTDRADENLLGAIAQDLKKWYGLTLRQII